MSAYVCDSEQRDALDLSVAAAFSSCNASMARRRDIDGDAPIADAAPRDRARDHHDEVSARRRQLLMQIDRQCDRLLMSTEEKEYLAKVSSMIATLNLVESIASIDALKLCIVCSRFYPRIEIGAELRLLKAEIEAYLRGGASESSMERHDVRFVA